MIEYDVQKQYLYKVHPNGYAWAERVDKRHGPKMVHAEFFVIFICVFCKYYGHNLVKCGVETIGAVGCDNCQKISARIFFEPNYIHTTSLGKPGQFVGDYVNDHVLELRAIDAYDSRGLRVPIYTKD